jgi:hypothetical protein
VLLLADVVAEERTGAEEYVVVVLGIDVDVAVDVGVLETAAGTPEIRIF